MIDQDPHDSEPPAIEIHRLPVKADALTPPEAGVGSRRDEYPIPLRDLGEQLASISSRVSVTGSFRRCGNSAEVGTSSPVFESAQNIDGRNLTGRMHSPADTAPASHRRWWSLVTLSISRS